jgi:hypothetical protein
MKYSTNAIRLVSILALVLIGLLQAPSGPTPVQRERVLAAWDGARARLNHERLFSRRLRGADQKAIARSSEAYSKLPIRFEANAGQTDERVKFLSRGSGYSLFLTPTEAVLTLRNEKTKNDAGRQSIVRMKLIGANPSPQVEGMEAMPGKSNYFIGNDPSRWRRNVMNYARVGYRSVYPDIDMIYYGNQQQLEYDFVIAPGADPNTIRLSFDGVEQMEVDKQGDLILHTAGGEARQRKPMTYQEENGQRREIASRYVLMGEREVGFEVAAYDRARPLVIDPVLAYSTFLGGIGHEQGVGIDIDASGNAYLTGLTASLDFPTVNPLQPDLNGTRYNVFVAKLNREGSGLVYSTYLGGTGSILGGEAGYSIKVDKEGNAYVTGFTYSTDFPTKNPLQPASASPGREDAFVTKLNADGSELVFSTYLGGTLYDYGYSLAIDRNGDVYVAGTTYSADFPTKNPLQPAFAGGESDAFVTKLKSDGSALVYSTYLGGSGRDGEGNLGVAVDGQGSVYLAGRTESNDFPMANPLQPALAGASDAFVTKLNADGTALVYSTYLGGESEDGGSSIAVDSTGNAYVTGDTRSTNFPTAGPWQPALSGPADAFVTKLNRTGSALSYSTYLGGTGSDIGFGISADSQGHIYVTGRTYSLEDFPTRDAIQPIPDFSWDIANGFIVKLNAGGSGLVYSTYLGGGGLDQCSGLAVDAKGDAYVIGSTASEDFLTTPGAFQREFRGLVAPFDAFIIKIGNRRHTHNEHGQDDDRDSDRDRERPEGSH